jgi:hypothetical protein
MDYARNVVASQIVSANSAQWLVRTAMLEVVERGTGQKARIDGVDVFGKSGTAQKIDPATGQYSTTRHVSSFVCGAPADDPQVLVLVSVNEPTQGGSDFGSPSERPPRRGGRDSRADVGNLRLARSRGAPPRTQTTTPSLAQPNHQTCSGCAIDVQPARCRSTGRDELAPESRIVPSPPNLSRAFSLEL